MGRRSTLRRRVRDLLGPRWKGKIVSTFPNDDDAVLYPYKLIVDKYGFGTQEPADRVEAGTAAIALGADGMLTRPTA
ncbi:hypothetical protein ABZ078_01320 [Streptomyces sp. NPDC006385]|uniref:hypothetical protein n=1 Tax=Streptomyces sp. NPDC006385 TaxID=3156761 RepID=UPI0033AB6A2B